MTGATVEQSADPRASRRMPHNVEASGFRPSHFVGYDCTTRPGVWRIVKRDGGGWRASHSLNPSAGFIFGRNLAEVGAKLDDSARMARAFGGAGQ